VFVLNRHVERVFDPSGNENLGAAEAGARSMREDGNDVRFDANSGLAPDSAPCPNSATDRDRGEPRGSAPPTLPYVRVDAWIASSADKTITRAHAIRRLVALGLKAKGK